MKRYDSYKDSGVSWMGKIPSHWECVKTKWLLRERVEKSTDGLGEPLSMSQKYGLIPTSQMDMVPNGATSYIGAKKTYRGDMVLNKLKAHLGVFALSSFDGLVSPDYAVYKATERTDLDYLVYLFRTPMYISEFIKRTTGVAIGFNRLYTDDLFSIPTHYPSIDEQKAIANYLKVKTSKIEQYVARRERERELLESLKQSEIANVLTRGLNPNVPMKDSGIPWIGMIPEHWEVKKIRQCFKERREKVSDKVFAPLSVSKQGVTPQLDTAVKTDNGDNRKKVCIGDFVVNSRSDRKGSCGFSLYDGSVSLINIVLTPLRVNAKYYHYLFRSNNYIEEFYRQGRGIVADLWTTRYSEMKSIYIPVPPLPEQQAIVDYIESRVAKIDRCMADLQAEIDYLKEFKQRLISDAVTGQICVAEPQKGDKE